MRNPSAEEEATRDGVTLNAFTVSAVAKNVSTLRTAARADDEILARPGGAPPPWPIDFRANGKAGRGGA
jgi:hypothetical protein